MKNFNFGRKGFTLIEMLVVLSILALLVAGVAVSLPNQGKNARDSRRKVDIESVRSALELYRTDQTNGNYPGGTYATLSTTLTPIYLQTIPVDPTNAAPYTYAPTTSTGAACTTAGPAFCTTYTITYTLERTGVAVSLTPQSIAN